MRGSRAQQGFALLSVTLMSLLLGSQWLFAIEQRQQRQLTALALFVDDITDRRNLIRALAIQLERMPTASELTASQQDAGIVWDYEIDNWQPHSLRWTLLVPHQAWQTRLVNQTGGAVHGRQWSSWETLPTTAD